MGNSEHRTIGRIIDFHLFDRQQHLPAIAQIDGPHLLAPRDHVPGFVPRVQHVTGNCRLLLLEPLGIDMGREYQRQFNVLDVVRRRAGKRQPQRAVGNAFP